jgi:signal transduction histidine kinase
LTAIAFTHFPFLYKLILRPATDAFYELGDANASPLKPSFQRSHFAGGSMSSVPVLTKWRADRRLEKWNVRELRRLLEQQTEEPRHAESELLKQQPLAMIGEMAQFISHDIRQHLSAVYADLEFIGNANAHPPDREGLIEDVTSAIHAVTGLLDSLLLFAETGHALRSHLGSLNLVIESVVATLRAHPDATQVQILIKDMAPVEARMDHRRLGSAIYNLLLNACQAAKRGHPPRRVEIALSQDQSLIRVRVTDTGPGVPESLRETIFQPFTSGDGNGIGLGLTIAERGARDHGGLVCLEESSPRRTVFGLHLPKLGLGSLAAESGTGAVCRGEGRNEPRITQGRLMNEPVSKLNRSEQTRWKDVI